MEKGSDGGWREFLYEGREPDNFSSDTGVYLELLESGEYTQSESDQYAELEPAQYVPWEADRNVLMDSNQYAELEPDAPSERYVELEPDQNSELGEYMELGANRYNTYGGDVLREDKLCQDSIEEAVYEELSCTKDMPEDGMRTFDLTDSDTDEPSWGSSEFDTCSEDGSTTGSLPPDLSPRPRIDSETPSEGYTALDRLRIAWRNRYDDEAKEVAENPLVILNVCDDKYPPPELPPSPTELESSQLVRRSIVTCILQSENSYVQSLQRILNEYETPLQAAAPTIISVSKIRRMFFRVRDLLQCHFMFRIGLSGEIRNWDSDECIGACFTALFSKNMVIDVYSDYVNNFSLSMETIKRCAKTKPVFAQFLQQRQANSPDKLSLFGMMVKPIQRLPQFILLLQDLLKNTPDDHRDRFNLQLALTEVEKVAHKLNERKKISNQTMAARQLFKNMKGRYLKEGQQAEKGALLVRQDDVLGMKLANEAKEWKALRIIMLNDTLMCTTVKDRSIRHKFKWSAPLKAVDIKDTVITPDNNVVLSGQPGQVIISSSRPVRAGSTSSPMYAQLDDMIHDFAVITRVSSLVSSLKCSYEALSEDDIHQLTRGIQMNIQQLDDHLRTVDSNSLQLLINTKSGHRQLIIEFANAQEKQSWLEDLKVQKLLTSVENNPAWLDGAPSESPYSDYPNRFKQLNVNITGEMKSVTCGVVFAVPSLWNDDVYKPFLWMCGYGQQSNATIVNLENSHVTESFFICVEEVKCVVFVPDVRIQQGGRYKSTDCVLMATVSGQVQVHSVEETKRQEPVLTFRTRAPVESMCHNEGNVFIGLTTGELAVYKPDRNHDWTCADTTLKLGDRPVTSLCSDGPYVWSGCGTVITRIDTMSLATVSSFVVPIDESQSVQHLARVGVGLFVGCSMHSHLQLYHTETFAHLQDIHIASNQNDPERKAYITALAALQSWLWIGTSSGSVLLLPLPRLEGVPLVSSKPVVSRHTHHNPVRFILSSISPMLTIGMKREQGLSMRIDEGKKQSDTSDSIWTGPDASYLKKRFDKERRLSRSTNDLDRAGYDLPSIGSLYSSLMNTNDALDECADSLVASDSILERVNVRKFRFSMTLPSPRSEKKDPFADYSSPFTDRGDGKKTRDKSIVAGKPFLVLSGGEGYVDFVDSAKTSSHVEPIVLIWHCQERH